MQEKPILQLNTLVKYIITFIIIGTVLLSIWYFSEVVAGILLGLILSLIARPIFNLLNRIQLGKFKIPRAVSSLVSLLLIGTIVVSFFVKLTPLLVDEVTKITDINPEQIIVEFKDPINKTVRFLEKYGIMEFSTLEDSIKNKTQYIVVKMTADSSAVLSSDTISAAEYLQSIEPNDSEILHSVALQNMVENYFVRLFNWGNSEYTFQLLIYWTKTLLKIIIIALFCGFFFLKDKNLFKRMIFTFIPKRYEEKTKNVINETGVMLSKYFVGLSIDILLVMTLTSIAMLIIGFNFKTAITIGFVCGILNIIPYVGPLLGIAFALFITVGANINVAEHLPLLPLLSKTFIACMVVQLIDANILQPYIYSNRLAAHPLEIFLVIIIAGSIAGIPGMMFAVPGYTFLRIIARQFFQNFTFVQNLTKHM